MAFINFLIRLGRAVNLHAGGVDNTGAVLSGSKPQNIIRTHNSGQEGVHRLLHKHLTVCDACAVNDIVNIGFNFGHAAYIADQQRNVAVTGKAGFRLLPVSCHRHDVDTALCGKRLDDELADKSGGAGYKDCFACEPVPVDAGVMTNVRNVIHNHWIFCMHVHYPQICEFSLASSIALKI